MNERIEAPAEDLTTSTFAIQRPGDLLELVARDVVCAVLLDRQLHPDFFDLSTGFAGELVQKCTNYQVRVAVVCNDRSGWSPNFRRFADESTRHGQFVFVQSVEEALTRFAS